MSNRGYNGKVITVVSPEEEFAVLVKSEDTGYMLHTKGELEEALDALLQDAVEEDDHIPWYDRFAEVLDREEE